MSRMILPIGVFLVALGIASYLLSGGVSVTALIPTFFGAPLVACGLWLRRASNRRPALITTAIYSALGTLAVAPRFLGSLQRWSEGLSLALVAQALLFLSLIVALRSSLREIRAKRDAD